MGRIGKFVGVIASTLLCSPAFGGSDDGVPASRANYRSPTTVSDVADGSFSIRSNMIDAVDLGGGVEGLAYSQPYRWFQASPWSGKRMGGTTGPSWYLYPRGLTYDMVRSTTSEIGGGQLIFGLCDPSIDPVHCAPNSAGAPTALTAYILTQDPHSVFLQLLDTVIGLPGIPAERGFNAYTADGSTWTESNVGASEDGRTGFFVRGSNGGHIEADYIQADRQLIIAPKPLSWFRDPANAPMTDGIQIPCKRGVNGGCTVDAVVISTPTPTAATGYSWASLCTPNKAPQ